MSKLERIISNTNADSLIEAYLSWTEEIGNPLVNHSGLVLLRSLKREAVRLGPYPHVTMFEAANRIMSDLVILYGVRWLLRNDVFPFDTYTVEYGNEDTSGFDIRAASNGETLIGEAFNVAPSFFQGKKTMMLRKLRKSSADYKVIMFNDDAVDVGYRPDPGSGEYFLFVRPGPGDCKILPKPVVRRTESL